jgi:integrase
VLQKGRIRSFLVERLRQGKVRTVTDGDERKKVQLPLARDSVPIIHATLRGLLNAAIDDGIIVANPADKLGRALRLVVNSKTRQEEVKVMVREQLAAFLAAAGNAPSAYERRHYPLFLRTGMRLGEGLALQWDDMHFADKEIRVARTLSGGRIETLKTARLSLHFSPHCLRHTFASLMLQQGESPAYVQRQLGHASIQLTVDTCGQWLPLGNKAAVNRLDDEESD